MSVLPEFSEHKKRAFADIEQSQNLECNLNPRCIIGAGALLYGVCALISGDLPAPVAFTDLRLYMSEEMIRLSNVTEIAVGAFLIEAPRGLRWLNNRGLHLRIPRLEDIR